MAYLTKSWKMFLICLIAHVCKHYSLPMLSWTRENVGIFEGVKSRHVERGEPNDDDTFYGT